MRTIRRNENSNGLLGCVGAILLFALVIGAQIQLNKEVHTGTFVCVKTYTVTTGDRDSVSTSKRVDLRPVTGGPVETMVCNDALALLQFNSATIYANFEVGKRYRIEARGPRSPAFSMFPNVTSAVEVHDE